jgi:hypothetical protein
MSKYYSNTPQALNKMDWPGSMPYRVIAKNILPVIRALAYFFLLNHAFSGVQ